MSLVLKYAKILGPSVGLMSKFPILIDRKLLIDRVYQLNSNPYGPTLYSRALISNKVIHTQLLSLKKDIATFTLPTVFSLNVHNCEIVIESMLLV